MKTRVCHELISLFYSASLKNFAADLKNVEAVQRQRLSEILQNLQGSSKWKELAGHSYEELTAIVPKSTYSDYSKEILQQKKSGENILSNHIVRYEPTSGSTEQRKWIPYSKNFLSEINKAAAVWLGDIYKTFPKVKEGTHYWSLSWLPHELRAQTSSDDAELFPFYQRWILQNTMSVSSKIAHLENSEAAWWATLVSLAADEKLCLVSVWSPTFWLKVVKDLKEQWSDIAEALHEGTWKRHATEIEKTLGLAPQRKNLPAKDDINFFEKLWPKLILISAWDSSSSQLWAKEICDLFPKISFQGKGLWATEGVLTVPFRGKKILTTNAHFYEFRDLKTEEILPAWRLQEGRVYQPILWTSSGLLRYQLQDRVKVTGFLEGTPCFEFMGRLQSTDLVGEKMDAGWVQELFSRNPHWRGICLVACRRPQPHYVLVHESSEMIDIEMELAKLHHYKVAREIGQLKEAQSLGVQDVFQFLEKVGRSGVLGQNKIEVLLEKDSLLES